MLQRDKSEQCPPQHLLCNTLWQIYCKNTVSFIFTILCTVLTTRIKYSPWYWYVYWWTPSVNDTLFLLQKVDRIKEQPFIRAGFAIPEGALLSGFHCTVCVLLRIDLGHPQDVSSITSYTKRTKASEDHNRRRRHNVCVNNGRLRATLQSQLSIFSWRTSSVPRYFAQLTLLQKNSAFPEIFTWLSRD